ncbi:hypothetical protein N7495_005149 [Penicillium taxi]|uniref:uncharacterized protein n=1 Tax=Penicillium taxi TaxID=168475 RepID=UPI002545B6D0|nr:uncharacterized protein N7495_005149 [Penicillium taxi]KAJ5893458.1 hypothetical protein N7495_005149 [Penicillium taxi]
MAEGDSSVVIPPRKSHLALAFAILKHKPEGKTVKEYILELRNFIKKAKDVDSLRSGETGQFFDSITFWQKAYEASEAEQIKLHNKIYELEQRNNNALANLNVESVVNGVVPAKRLSTDANLDEPGKGKKRLSKRSKGKKAQDASTDTEESGADPTRLVRQVFTLQCAIQKKRRSKAIITDAVIVCKIAELEILEAVQRFIQPANEQENAQSVTKQPNLPTVIRAVRLSFQLVQQAIQKINGLKDEKKGRAQITYYLVCLFESGMTALTQLCTAISKRGPAAKKSKRAGKQCQRQLLTEDETAQQLVDLLVIMVVALDLQRREDQELMEGFLSVALGRVGKLLALFVFEDLKQPTDLPPDGLVAMIKEGVSPQEAKIEATYLLGFMERVLGDGCPLLSNLDIAGSQFFQPIKERLQKTLMQAVFGNDDPLFQQGGLDRPPTPPILGPGSQQVGKAKFAHFFTQELWRLVGWDILRSALEP